MGTGMKRNSKRSSKQDARLGFDFFQPPQVDVQGEMSPAMQRLTDILSAPSVAHARTRGDRANLPSPLVYRDMGLFVYLRDLERFRPSVIATRPPRLTSIEVMLETRAALCAAVRSLPTGSSCWLWLETGSDDVRYSALLEGMRGVSKAARLVHVPHDRSAAGAWSTLMVMRTEEVLPQIDRPHFELLENDETEWHAPEVNAAILEGLLAASAAEASLAADPFAGDGTMLCAAHRVGLFAYGHETSPVLLERATERGVSIRALYSDEPLTERGTAR